jgi:addiction module HigA family antidote
MLRLEFLEPEGITPYRLAKDIGVPQTRIERILDGKRSITPDTAMRLGRYFGTAPQMWLNMQSHYDLMKLRAASESDYDAIKPRNPAADAEKPALVAT